MNSILKASYSTLVKSKNLISKLSDSQLSNKTVSPYYSSIGSHVRHILDFYKCIFNGIDRGLVDLTERERNVLVEIECCSAHIYVDEILTLLKQMEFNSGDLIKVKDNLGDGLITMDYTFSSLFSQANSHTIHHYAIINYILDRLEISLDDDSFGFNPTSPKSAVKQH